MADQDVCRGPLLLVSLPFDVLIEIFKWVPILDMLNLRRTCKSFEELSRDRTVWLSLLRRSCYQEDVPEEQFDLEKMSALEVEKMCLKPYVFEHLLLPKDPISVAYTERTMFFQSPIDNEFINEWNELEADVLWQYQVIPGGRYIITLNLSGWLRVWDMWNATETKPVGLIASRKFPACESSMIIQRSVESPSIITIVVRSGRAPHDDQPSRRMDVLQLHLREQPRLTDLIASATIPYSPDSLWSCDGHHVAALGPNNTATVWNYVTNTWACASIVGVDEQLVTTLCFLDIVDDVVIFVVPDGNLRLYQFRLTDMHPSLDEAQQHRKCCNSKTYDFSGNRVTRTHTMAYWRPRILEDDDARLGTSAIDIILGSENSNDQILLPFHFSSSAGGLTTIPGQGAHNVTSYDNPSFYPTLSVSNKSLRYLIYTTDTSLGVEVIKLMDDPAAPSTHSVRLACFPEPIHQGVRPHTVALSSFSASIFFIPPAGVMEVKEWRFHPDSGKGNTPLWLGPGQHPSNLVL